MPHPLRAESLSWTGLLAQWVRFAQASLAVPADADGAHWRASVPAVINLQAVTFALADLHRLADEEQALAIDKAEILIRENAARLDSVWEDQEPASLREIAMDAEAALAMAKRVRLEKTDS